MKFRLINMKVRLMLFFTFLISFNLYCQETKFIVKADSYVKEKGKSKSKERNTAIVLRNDFIEEYYVLKSHEDIRHGTYVKYMKRYWGIQILESGNYQNGQQTGLWEYYHDIPLKKSANSIKEKGHYANGKKNGVWTSYYADTIPALVNQERFGDKKRTDSINIKIEQQSVRLKMAGMYLNGKRIGEWSSFTYSGDAFQKYNFSKQELLLDRSIKDSLDYNKNRSALFIGGIPCLIDFLSHEFQLPGSMMVKAKSDSASVIVSCTIDKNGNLHDTKVEKSNGYKELENEAIRITNLSINHWIPAIRDSDPIDSVYKIQFFIVRKDISPAHKTFRIGYKPILE